MDCLIGILEKPFDEESRKKGLIIATSLECNISSTKTDKIEAAKSLAKLLNAHLKKCSDGMDSNTHNEEAFERVLRYTAEHGMPEAFEDIKMDYGLRLRCYDLTK